MNSETILYIAYAVSALMLCFTVAIILFQVIPLQWREMKVRNGLAVLRKQLLSKGILDLTTALAAIVALGIRYLVDGIDARRYVVAFLLLTLSAGFLIRSILDRQIYRSNYTAKNKKLHDEFADREEEGVEKK